MRDSLVFQHTEESTREMIRRYMRCFDNKLLLLSHQVTDLSEKLSGDPTVQDLFRDDRNTYSLHNCMDRFLMSVLKSFLQSIDEGLADIIDELEDACGNESDLAGRLKHLVFEFQQASFDKRERFSNEYQDGKEELGKTSFAWFDSFFGDVTSLLKNPINANLFTQGQEGLVSGSSLGSPKKSFEPRVTEQWTKKDGGVIDERSLDPVQQAGRKSYGGADSTSEIGFEPKELGRSADRLSAGESEDVTWRVAFSQDDFNTALSTTKSAASHPIRPKKKSLDLKAENLNFEDIFQIEKYKIDGSGMSTFNPSHLLSLHGEPKQPADRHRLQEALPLQDNLSAKRCALRQ